MTVEGLREKEFLKTDCEAWKRLVSFKSSVVQERIFGCFTEQDCDELVSRRACHLPRFY